MKQSILKINSEDRELVKRIADLLYQKRGDGKWGAEGNWRDAERIVQAINDGLEIVPIEDIPEFTLQIEVDYVVFMFCFPWMDLEGEDRYNKYCDSFRRLPKPAEDENPTHEDQSSGDYGQWSFETAGDYSVDVMVGYWQATPELENGQETQNASVSTVYEHFEDSIRNLHNTNPNIPKIAYMIGYMPHQESHTSVFQAAEDAIDDWLTSDIGFYSDRYFTFPDQNGNMRFPLFFWGIEEIARKETVIVDGEETTEYFLNEHRINETAAILEHIRNQTQHSPIKPFLIWEGQLLHYFNSLENSQLKERLRTEVIGRLDGIYQHGCYIPACEVYTLPDEPNWQTFPRYDLHDSVPGENLTIIQKTLQMVDHLHDIIDGHNLKSPDGKKLYVIPGTFPQYSRELFTYNHECNKGKKTLAEIKQVKTRPPIDQIPDIQQGYGDLLEQSRVICTDISDLDTLLRSIGFKARQIYTSPSSEFLVKSHRFVALTSWNEWAEGQTFEPCTVPPGYDPSIYGMNYGDEFIEAVHRNLKRFIRQIKVTPILKGA